MSSVTDATRCISDSPMQGTRPAMARTASSCAADRSSVASSRSSLEGSGLSTHVVRRRSLVGGPPDQMPASPTAAASGGPLIQKVRGGHGDKRVRGGQNTALGGQAIKASASQGSLRASFSGAALANAGSGSFQDMALGSILAAGSLEDLACLLATSPRMDLMDSAGGCCVPAPFLEAGSAASSSSTASLLPSSPSPCTCDNRLTDAQLLRPLANIHAPSAFANSSPEHLANMMSSLKSSFSSMMYSPTCLAAAASDERNERDRHTVPHTLPHPIPHTLHTSFSNSLDRPSTSPSLELRRGYSFGRAASMPFRGGSQLSLLAYAEEAVMLQQVYASSAGNSFDIAPGDTAATATLLGGRVHACDCPPTECGDL